MVFQKKKKKKTYNLNDNNNEFYLFSSEVGKTGQEKKTFIYLTSQVIFHTEISCKVLIESKSL